VPTSGTDLDATASTPSVQGTDDTEKRSPAADREPDDSGDRQVRQEARGRQA